MNNKRRDELIERLKRPKKKMVVAIIDDLAKEYREKIKSEIDVTIYDFSIDDIWIELEKFDVIFLMLHMNKMV